MEVLDKAAAAPVAPIPPAGTAAADDPVESAELSRWQEKLRPLMSVLLVGLAVLFFALSVWDFLEIRSFVRAERGDDVSAALLKGFDANRAAASPDDRQRESLLLFEADALDKRYHQASALLMSRIWEKHMAFLTGMVLAFLGATFVLGRLREARSTLSGGTAQLKAEISSASPGIILAFLGAVLLVTSLLIHVNIDVHDAPIYFRTHEIAAAPRASLPPLGRAAAAESAALPPPIDVLNLGGSESDAGKRKP